jgi:ABC-2 type transport system permease protein
MNELSSVQGVYLVARREFLTRARNRVFAISTILAIAAVGGYALLQLLVLDRISSTPTPTFTVGFTTDAGVLAQPLQATGAALGARIHVMDVGDQGSGESLVQSGTLDALVTGTPASPRVIVESGLDSTLGSALNVAVKQATLDAQLRSAGLDPAAVQARANAASIKVQVLQPARPNGYQQPIVGLVVAFALFLFLQIYGAQIAQGIVAEKASRVVEILLATVRPAQLLVGKVLGIGLVGLLQLVVVGAAALAITLPTHVLTIPAVAAGAVAGGLLWSVLGFLLYGLLLAMVAAPVSRTEEAQSATLPVVLLLGVGWVLALTLVLPQEVTLQSGGTPSSGTTTATAILSVIPAFAPVLMPIRIAAGDAPASQLVLAVALVLASIAGAAWAASRVYANSVLRFGARVPLMQAFWSRQ